MTEAEQFNRTASGGAQAGLERLREAQLQAEQLLDVARVTSRSPSPAIVKRAGSTKSVLHGSSVMTSGLGGSSSSYALGVSSSGVTPRTNVTRGGGSKSAASDSLYSANASEGNLSEMNALRSRLTSHLSQRYSGASSKSGSITKVIKTFVLLSLHCRILKL